VHVELGGHGLVDGDQELAELGGAVARCSSAITVPSAMLNAANRLEVPWRM
jgi:hypothetical protein